MGPPFQVDVLLILTFTPCFSAVAASCQSYSDLRCEGLGLLAGFLKLLPRVTQEEAFSPWQ